MEEEILNAIVEKINELPSIHCNITEYEVSQNKTFADPVLKLQILDKKILLYVEVKSKIVPAQIPKIKQLQDENQSIMIAAHYITPKAQKILTNEGIPYADTAGNMFFKAEGIYILVKTKQTHRDKLNQSNRAFTKAGLKVVYQFLIDPKNINAPYRKIASLSKVTIDTVGKAIKGLLNERFILKVDNKNYRIVEKEKLLQKWVTEYNQTLKTKLQKRRFRWSNQNKNWKDLLLPLDTYWGGAAAAEILTNYLIADNWTLYTDLDFIEIMEKCQLIPDKKGEVVVIKKFWNESSDNINIAKDRIVHPILVYADLIEDPNFRYVETAKKIYNEYVKNNL